MCNNTQTTALKHSTQTQTFSFENVGKFADLFQQLSVCDLTGVIRVVTFPVNHVPLQHYTGSQKKMVPKFSQIKTNFGQQYNSTVSY